MSKSILIGRMVRALVDGGWELTGRVTHDKDDRIILSTYEGETLLVFKKKISAMLLLREEASASKPPQSDEVSGEIAQNKNFALFKPARSKGGAKNPTKYQEGPADDLSEGGVSLPHEVLLSSLAQTKVSTRSDDDDDFSISMTSLFSGNNSRISVTSDDDSE